jgi:hypothetical protein
MTFQVEKRSIYLRNIHKPQIIYRIWLNYKSAGIFTMINNSNIYVNNNVVLHT